MRLILSYRSHTNPDFSDVLAAHLLLQQAWYEATCLFDSSLSSFYFSAQFMGIHNVEYY